MEYFFIKSNKMTNKKIIIGLTLLLIVLYLMFTSIKETQITDFYSKWLYYDEEMKNDVMEDWTEKEDGYLEFLEQRNTLIKMYNSFASEDQTFFLQFEKENLKIYEELEEAYEKLNYFKYNKGKAQINDYLIKNKLSLKSIEYSTDSGIFVMNILEFLATPVFFLLFFLLTPMTYYKKYEGNRINLLLTQPILRQDIIWKEYKLFIKNISNSLIFISISSFMASFVTSQQCHLTYPILLTLLGKTQVVPIYLYMLILVISFYFIGTVLFFLTYISVLLVRKVVLSILLVTILCLFLTAITNTSTSIFNGVNPFAYMNIEKMIKTSKTNTQVKYIDQTSKKKITLTEYVIIGNVTENPYYYANESLASRIWTVSIVLMPIILGVTAIILFFVSAYLLTKLTI